MVMRVEGVGRYGTEKRCEQGRDITLICQRCEHVHAEYTLGAACYGYIRTILTQETLRQGVERNMRDYTVSSMMYEYGMNEWIEEKS